MKTVSLLCRGASLGYVGNIPQVKHSVIVNAFHYEAENKSVHEYLAACSTVTHILSLAAYFPQAGANNIYKKYIFDKTNISNNMNQNRLSTQRKINWGSKFQEIRRRSNETLNKGVLDHDLNPIYKL